MAVNIIGIIFALVLFMVLVYKGVSSFIVAPICACIIAVTNALNPVTTFYTYADGLGQMFIKLFAILFCGVLLGKIYSSTKAAASIAKTLTNKFIIPREGNAQISIQKTKSSAKTELFA